ncbi:MAG: hypothetical protein LBU12_06655 [Deltaproteobacteria bacterium]|jgi:predicted Mrr-cat superfamily restriction endonuclease|nr:hypothetical protein [Deltaproteobacteria bacterium]
MSGNLWVVRPEPNFVNRLDDFLRRGMVAVGWPATGDLGGCLDRAAMTERLLASYEHYSGELKSDLAVAAGVLDRFVNQIQPGDLALVPNGEDVYLSDVVGRYEFHPELGTDAPDAGYPHWRRVTYRNEAQPHCRIKDLPLGVRRSIDCRLSVFSVRSAAPALRAFLSL